jgi:hypothetical protein
MATTVNGIQCTQASITLPMSGAWIADVGLTLGATLSGSVSVVTEDLTLSGTVFRSVTHAGNTQARLVGGAGKWGKRVQPKAYKSLPGLKLAPIVRDAARLCGESVGTIPDVSVGSWFSRRSDLPASQVMRLIPETMIWWIDDAGLTQIGNRTTGVITELYDVVSVDGSSGRAIIAADRLTQFRPGRTMESPTVDGSRIIDSITWHSAATELRGEVYWT